MRIEASSRYPELKREMQQVLEDSRRLAQESVDRVQRMLAELGIELDPPARARRSAEDATRALRDLFGH